MTQPQTTPPALPWALIAGLASMTLLWPLTALLGMGAGAARSLVLLGVIGLTWILSVGLARVPRPVLVLALVGVLGGAVQLVVAAALGGGPPWWAHLVALGTDALWGAIAGLLALGLQRLLPARRRPRQEGR
ncbi:hypothetical protein [Brachybacterium hainanense]|uniref:Histidinol dehydrogenase n=1 Tax=Brachybacterium hainanense TaxID=1541174 RepID=A0ABV6RGX2_9MICO